MIGVGIVVIAVIIMGVGASCPASWKSDNLLSIASWGLASRWAPLSSGSSGGVTTWRSTGCSS